MTGSTKIAAYFYGEKPLCSSCVRDIVIPYYLVHNTNRSTESILSEVAQEHGINRNDEASFHSHEFPKPILKPDLIDGEKCFVCGRTL